MYILGSMSVAKGEDPLELELQGKKPQGVAPLAGLDYTPLTHMLTSYYTPLTSVLASGRLQTYENRTNGIRREF